MLRRERVALGDAVVTAVESVQPLVSERRHRLSVTLPDEPLFVDGDLARITQILTNLLTNAAKYMDAGGQIWLDLRREERWAVARIRDTGMGIGRDVLPHVFRLFVQADQTRHRAQGGLGLGLGVVKRLVELHGGTVDAASDGPGQGSEFTVRLPARVATEGSPVAHAPEGMPPLDGPLVLVPDGDRNGADTAAETPARHEPRDRLAAPRPAAPSSADERLVTVSVLMRLIASNADLGKTCDAVAEAAVRLLGARVARVWLNDPGQRTLTACGTFGVDPNATVALLEATQISHDSGMPGEAIRTRAPLYLVDAAGDYRWVNRRFVREIGVRGYAGLPLVTGDQIWGVLSVMFTTVRDFSAEDQALLELLADQSAIAIQSAQSRG